MAQNLNTPLVRFDRRLIKRNLREGRLKLEELEKYLADLEDVSHMAASAEEPADHTSYDMADDEEDED